MPTVPTSLCVWESVKDLASSQVTAQPNLRDMELKTKQPKGTFTWEEE